MNQETSQTILSGMGELHLEVIKHRILSEFKVDAYMGPLQIAYRETIGDDVTHSVTLDSLMGGSKQHVTVKLAVQPSKNTNPKRVVFYQPEKEDKAFFASPKFMKIYKSPIEHAVKNSLSYGMYWVSIKIILRFR